MHIWSTTVKLLPIFWEINIFLNFQNHKMTINNTIHPLWQWDYDSALYPLLVEGLALQSELLLPHFKLSLK